MNKRSLFVVVLTAVAVCLFSGFAANAQITVLSDTNFSPGKLSSGLTSPFGVAYRSASGDLVVTQSGANQVSTVNLTSGGIKAFVSQVTPFEISSSSNGTVAVTTRNTRPNPDQIDFYSSTGTLLGSITTASFPDDDIVCIGGSAFDTNGNFYVAAGSYGTSCLSSALYYFAGTMPWNSLAIDVVNFNGQDVIEGIAFNPVPAPHGSLIAVASNGDAWQVLPNLDCGTCSTFNTAGFAEDAVLSSVAIDPLLGDIYVTGTSEGGPAIFVLPPAGVEPIATTFATGSLGMVFNGIAFDNSGNLYVNDTAGGNLWKLTRNAFATAIVPILQGQPMTFINGNSPDEVQTIFIPPSAVLNGAASISVVFVPTNPTQLDSRLLQGSAGDASFFGGGPIPALSTCLLIPSASPDPLHPSNCLVSVQKCFDAEGNEQPICTVQVAQSSTDLIELTSSFNNGSLPDPGPAHFAIDFDTPSTNTATDISNKLLDCCSGGGSSKGLCSQTYFFMPGASSFPDFSIGPISPITVSAGGTSSPATVTLTSLNSFSSAVTLGVTNVPPGITGMLNQTSITPTASTTLTVSTDSSFESATTTANIATLIANLLASGCIDDGGIANALTSKLSTAQAAINGRQLQTAVNALTAFKSQAQAQAGKHVGTSCSVTLTLNVTGQFTETSPPFSIISHAAAVSVTVTALNAASLLVNDASSLIHELAMVTNGDPITGFVLNNGVGVNGASVTISNGSSTFTAIPADATGFYYFPDTSVLMNGGSYTIKVTLPAGGFNNSSPASQTFTWTGKGQAFNFAVY